MPAPSKTQWKDLFNEVVATGLCVGCAGCVVVCPFHVLGYENYEPVQLQPEGPDICTHGDKGCTICTLACPRFRTWEDDANVAMFGRSRLPEEIIGINRAVVLARARDQRAADWLARARTALIKQAEAIPDAGLRQAFLHNPVPPRDSCRLGAEGGRC
jgi:ferredoxin